ncbi:MAG: flagellar biosynthesis anti-sigma factor FlgM [Burkholderiales bacterium]
MKIGPSFDSQAVGDRSGAKVEGKRTASGSASGSSSTRVQLSDLSTRIAEMESRLAAGEGFDTTKVEAIKQAISEGKFKVNADAVADKLLENVRDLLGRKESRRPALRPASL